MWAAPCSCTVGTKRMPAAGNRSSASMYAEPTMPNTSLTPCATRVSTNASEGVMRVRPETTMRFTSAMLVMEGLARMRKFFSFSQVAFWKMLIWRNAAQTGRSSSVRRHDPAARARDTPELRPVPAADVARPRLGTRDILVRDRAAEPRVGTRHALRRRYRRPLRRGARARRGRARLRPGTVGDGVLDRAARVRPRRGTARA